MKGRMVVAALVFAAGATGCGGRVAHLDVDRVGGAPSTVAPSSGDPLPWEPAPRDPADSNQWVQAGEAAAAAMAGTHPRVVFLGDSIIQWWTRFGLESWDRWFAPLGAANVGVAGDTTSNLLYRLGHGNLTGTAPVVVVIEIGTNDIPHDHRPADVVRGIEAVVAAVHQEQPAARLLLLGLVPRDTAGSSDRATVTAVNRLLAASGPVRTGQVTYLDPGRLLLQADGDPVPGALHADLLHPTALGYRLMSAELGPAIAALLQMK